MSSSSPYESSNVGIALPPGILDSLVKIPILDAWESVKSLVFTDCALDIYQLYRVSVDLIQLGEQQQKENVIACTTFFLLNF
jgi:hypothetical protein